MQTKTESIKSKDGKAIHYFQWTPNDFHSIKGVVQIVHGLAEHAIRYERFAKALIKEGYAVYASDNRGHGKTAGSEDQLGYFEDGNYWEKTIQDLIQLNQSIQEKHAGLPCFLFGHSGGSLLLRKLVTSYHSNIKGMVLSGTGGDPGALGRVGLTIAKGMALVSGRKKRSKTLDKMSFGQFNDAFKPNRTAFDWLSRDEAEVDKYINDPYCGQLSTTGLWIDLVTGVLDINSVSVFKATPNELPIYLVAGDQDPVGDKGKGVTEVFEKYKQHGQKDVQIKLYLQARHEILNETNRAEVSSDIIQWLNDRI